MAVVAAFGVAAGCGPGSGRAGDGGMAVRDCLPDCVSSRRAACERPPVDAGGACFVSTITTSSGAGQVDCYANGVQEIHTPADGGTLVTITTPDGHTVCYQVLVEGSGPQHYETPAGQEFAILTPAGGGLYNVTCGGTTVSVDINNPSCATQNGGSCTSGTCP